MMNRLFKLLSLCCLMSVSLPSFADDDHEKARRLLESGDILALEVILQKAHNIQPGKILEVELETDKDRKVYEIEILARDGKVLELVFDARSGEHISTKNED